MANTVPIEWVQKEIRREFKYFTVKNQLNAKENSNVENEQAIKNLEKNRKMSEVPLIGKYFKWK